ncbi:MAG TPA: hypothetical protein VHA52_12150, partial [Candidatus Babeliaceae bacterium]|nr:hypothetical protein [Candidatus Babeliaceae bacterium]
VPFGKFGFVKKQSIDWLKDHLSVIGGVALFLVVGMVAASRWVKGDAQADYLTAEIAYQHWEGGKGEALTRLQKIIRKHPELHAKYDGAIAQKLLSTSEKGLATSYGKAALKRMGDFSPHYKNFSHCSLLIVENKLAEALQGAKELKAAMEKDEAFWEKKSELMRHGCILYAFNLLRIAMLEKEAGTPAGELAAWRAFKENAGWLGAQPASKTYDPEAYQLIQDNFHNQETSLLDYIKYREEFLTSKTP